MVHSGGFEPPTARFVAEYSIQLSYECIVGRIIGIETSLSNAFFLLIQKLTLNQTFKKPYSTKVAERAGFEPAIPF